jgi:hypothetical protein
MRLQQQAHHQLEDYLPSPLPGDLELFLSENPTMDYPKPTRLFA